MNVEGTIKIDTIKMEVLEDKVKFKGYVLFKDGKETQRIMFLSICKNEDLMIAYNNGFKIFIKGVLKKAKEAYYIEIKSFVPIADLTESENITSDVIGDFKSSGFVPSEMAKNAKVGFLNG
ncbi:hypothetical protein [uncultured Cetobacterium sp.]|uniref:hypothetical protein n=1 Tax=uncultured Cetobacterium sp. TaxID=527638 RepID=UPI00262C479E|nr:hypothetical protein [uncultured Cetobacterium sp.]